MQCYSKKKIKLKRRNGSRLYKVLLVPKKSTKVADKTVGLRPQCKKVGYIVHKMKSCVNKMPWLE